MTKKGPNLVHGGREPECTRGTYWDEIKNGVLINCDRRDDLTFVKSLSDRKSRNTSDTDGVFSTSHL